MAIIKCPECGQDVSDMSQVCIHCGYPLNKETLDSTKSDEKVSLVNKLSEKKKFIGITAGVVIIIVLIFVMVGNTVNNRLYKAKKYYENNDIESFSKIKGELRTEEVTSMTEILSSDIDDIKNQYIDEEITYEDAIEALEDILQYSDTAHLTSYVETEDYINTLKSSRDAFDKAKEDEGAGKYQSAYDNYSKVIEDDSNYPEAQSKKEEMQFLLYQEYVADAKEYASKEDYSNAVSMLNKAKKYDEDNSEIDSLLTEYKQKQEEIDKKAEQEAREKALMEPGKVITTDHMTASFVEADLTDHIYPDSRSGIYTYYSVKETGTTWMDIKFKVKNSGTGILNLDTMVQDVCATYDGNLEYTSYALFYSTGKDIDRVYEYMNNSIDPLQEVTLHITIEMPVEAKTSEKSLEVTFALDGEKQLLIYQ
jgi:tetratricopeptide (TPR) repeat protein